MLNITSINPSRPCVMLDTTSINSQPAKPLRRKFPRLSFNARKCQFHWTKLTHLTLVRRTFTTSTSPTHHPRSHPPNKTVSRWMRWTSRQGRNHTQTPISRTLMAIPIHRRRPLHSVLQHLSTTSTDKQKTVRNVQNNSN